MKLIEYYHQWVKDGYVQGRNGLCDTPPFINNPSYAESFELFIPTKEENIELKKEGFDLAYWASGLPTDTDGEDYLMTPLRETIVLLICAMHDEL